MESDISLMEKMLCTNLPGLSSFDFFRFYQMVKKTGLSSSEFN